MKTTLANIRAHSPCADGWTKLLAHLGKTKADDGPLSIITVLDSNGLEDSLWCLRAVKGHDREIRLYAVWCARQVQHLMKDPRSLRALDVSERFANDAATRKELFAAWDAAVDAAWDAAKDAARAAASGAARDAAGCAAKAAAWDAAKAAAWYAARDATSDAAWKTAWDAAKAAAWDAQAQRLRKVCQEIETREQA